MWGTSRRVEEILTCGGEDLLINLPCILGDCFRSTLRAWAHESLSAENAAGPSLVRPPRRPHSCCLAG